MATFDFLKTFDDIGRIFIRGLKRRIEQQVGIDGQGYSYPKPSTLKKRKAQKIGTKFFKGTRTKVTKGDFHTSVEEKDVYSRGLAVNIKRLHVTRDTANRGFAHSPDSTGVTIFVSTADHKSAKATYRDIIRWNSRGQPVVNPYIVNPPLVFPVKDQEVLHMKEELDRAAKVFSLDLKKQLRDYGIVRAKTILNIG